jgi:hypothetical protein
MSLMNLCGVPSLWLDPKDYADGGSQVLVTNENQESKLKLSPFIKPL